MENGRMRKLANIVPRVYQKRAVKAALAGLTGRSKRALVVLATGLGKTLTAALIAKKFRAKRILFLVHNNFILEHARDEFALVFDPNKFEMAIYNGLSKNGAGEADIVFATWQTMGRNLKEWKRNHFDLIVVDEAHHTEAETYKPVVVYFTGAKLGITATPDRADKLNIRPIFGDEVVNVSLEEAIAKGWLPEIEYHVVTDESLDEDALQNIMADIRRGKKRFTMAEVNRRIFIRKRDEEIAAIINGYKEKAVVFCPTIPHAERMSAALERSATFHSKTGRNQKDTWNKNQAVLNALNKGTTIRRVCAVNAFNEGVNVPSVGLIAFCRVTDTVTIFRQQLGRGLRPGKDKLIVLDFVGNLERIKLLLQMIDKIEDFDGGGGGGGGKRQKFDVSGAGFKFTFSDEIVDLVEILKNVEKNFYPTWEEAGEAARRLGITSAKEYKALYKKDVRLPSNPDSTYPNFPGWLAFLDTEANFYSTWQEAGRAARKLNIFSASNYRKLYRQDPRLPSAPNQMYADFPGWKEFLSTGFYPTWQEASTAAKKLGIKSSREYKLRYKADKRLPSTPNETYSDFPDWLIFLGTDDKFYPTWQEASTAVRGLGIISSVDYMIRKRYREDPRLPSNPDVVYSNFPGWPMFLRGETKEFYETWQEAAEAVQRLGITSRKEYHQRRKEDKHLPSNLYQVYPDFPGFRIFLGKK